MSHNNSEQLYGDLAEKLNDTIPVEWDKIFLRSEVEVGAIELCYWFIDSQSKEIIQNFDMPNKYGIDKKLEKIAFSEMTDIIENINNALIGEGNEPFTIFTFILDNEGRFKVKLDYVDLQNSSVLERRAEWTKEHLIP